MRKSRSEASPLAVSLLVLGLSLADPVRGADLKVGADVFAAECAECHSLRPDKHKKGPSLFGMMGRRAADIAGVSYSDALKQSQWTWDEATLRRYLMHPSGALPGGKMKYEGLRDQRDLDHLIAYLATVK